MTAVTVDVPGTRDAGGPGRVPRAKPRVRHGVLAAALAAVAGLRAGQEDWLWAGLLAVGAAAEATLLLLDRRRRGTAGPDGTSAASAGAPPSETTLLTSLAAHRRAARTWTVLTVVALLAAVGLLAGDPALAAVVAVVGVVALRLRRRSRLTVERLEQLVAPRPTGPEEAP